MRLFFFSGKVLNADIMKRQIRLKETCYDNSETITKQMFNNKVTDNEGYEVYLLKKYSIRGELWNMLLILSQM